MGFVLKQSDSYVWPVEVLMATDGGRYEKSIFDVEFKRVPQSRINELVNGGVDGSVNDRLTCEELVVGWRGVTDGVEELPFSVKNLGVLLDIPGVERAVVTAWIDSLTGAKRKN